MVSSRLKQARIEAGLTLQEAANRAGLDVTTIWRYENGRRQPSGASLYSLAHIYGKGIEYFWAENGGPGSATQSQDRGLAKIRIKGIIGDGSLVEGWEQDLGGADVPGQWLRTAPRAFAIRVSGNSLVSVGIQDGEVLVLDPDSRFIDGKVYIFWRSDDEQTIFVRKVYTSGRRRYKLVSGDGSVEDVDRRDVHFIGRVRWSLREH